VEKYSVVDPDVMGNPDPDPSSFVRIRLQILPSTIKISKKTLDFNYFVTSF
jgi:hypothetical protein